MTSEPKEKELNFNKIIENSREGILIIDKEGMILFANPAAHVLLNQKNVDLIGKSFGHPLDDDKLVEMGIVRLNDKVGVGEMRFGETIWEGKKTTLVLLLDVTERKLAEERLIEEKKNLEKVNLELDSFVYMASHDLRAPLRAISSFASFLEEDYKNQLDEAGRDHLLEIRKGVGRMTKLIDDLLTLSKISRIQNPYEVVDMNSLVKSAWKRIQFDFGEKNAKLRIQPHLAAVSCDRIKMEEVFVNLLNNAIKFSLRSGREPQIEVGSLETEDAHQFYVADNGIGIEPRFHEQIFGLFKRLHTQEEYEGTGAGLNIVKRVIEDQQGRIWVESELGKGAKFIFTIPKNFNTNPGGAK